MRERKRKPVRIPKVSVADGLQAGRIAINSARFDKNKTEIGVDGLKNYRREWDDDLKTFRENPVKDWSEHIGSAWRYLGLSWRNEATKAAPEKPKTQVFKALPNGAVQSNISIREAIDDMIARKKRARR